MDATVAAVFAIVMRWIHMVSVATILGSFLYVRFALQPSIAAGPDTVARYTRILYFAMGGALISGLYNYLTKPAIPPHYHMIIGIKLLLVLHVFAIGVLYANPNRDQAKRTRWATSLIISALIIFALSAYLRWISLSPVVKLP